MKATVPAPYLGVWKRALLRTPSGDDTTSTVYWLQTPRWHADIRVPANRDAGGARSLEMLEDAGWRSLASQQGFAGVTTVENDICRWHRRVDYQPPSGFNDVGRIEFESPDRMLEYGVEQDYFEIWERQPASVGSWVALEGSQGTPPAWLFATGDFAMRVRPRACALSPAPGLGALLQGLDTGERRARLDFEISLARRTSPARWDILHSTLPWKEGTSLEESSLLGSVLGNSGPLPIGWASLD